MEDIAYTNALRRRRQLQAEMKEIDNFLELWKRYAGTEPEHSDSTDTPRIRRRITRNAGAKPRKKTLLTNEQLAPIVRDILIAEGHPMTRGMLVAALVDSGFTVGGVQPNRNMGTIMWRLRDRFTNIEGEGYWPKDLPYASANYSPEGEDEPAKAEMAPT